MNRVDRKVALLHSIIYPDDRLPLVSSWHLTYACPPFFVYCDNCVWDSGVYSDLYNLLSVGNCIWPILFTSYWLGSLMSKLLHLLISCGMTIVNLFITFINSVCASMIQSWRYFKLFIVLPWQVSLHADAGRMQHHRLHHAFPWCMPCMGLSESCRSY